MKKIRDFFRHIFKHMREIGFLLLAPMIISFGVVALLSFVCSFGKGCSRDIYFIAFMFGVGSLVFLAYKYSELELSPIHYVRTLFFILAGVFGLALVSGLLPN